MFNKILRELGDHGKELFFVSPSIYLPKRKFLEMSKINYIESTGEDLIKEIYEDLKLNYIPGLSKGDGTADTAINFGQLNKIDLQISKRNDTLYIGKFSSLKGIGKTEMKFNLELPDDKRERILKALNGNSFDDFILDSEIIREFSHFFNGIRLANEENITKFHLRKRPNIEGIFDFIFEDGFELENYKMEVFIINPEENQYQIKINVTDFTIIIKLFTYRQENKTKYSIQIYPNIEISSVKTGLNFYNIVSRIANNKSFKLIKNDKPFYTYNGKVQFEGDPLDSTFLLNYFKKLKLIEQYFNVKFKNIDSNQINENIVEQVMAYIEKRVLKVKFEGLNFMNENKEERDYILETCKEKGVFLISENIKSTYCLHGLDFETGYLNQIIEDAYIVNTEDLINNITNKVEIKSRTESMQIEFSDEQDMLIKQ